MLFVLVLQANVIDKHGLTDNTVHHKIPIQLRFRRRFIRQREAVFLCRFQGGDPGAVPMGGFGDPEKDIGRVCVLLGSKDFKYMSGETIRHRLFTLLSASHLH